MLTGSTVQNSKRWTFQATCCQLGHCLIDDWLILFLHIFLPNTNKTIFIPQFVFIRQFVKTNPYDDTVHQSLKLVLTCFGTEKSIGYAITCTKYFGLEYQVCNVKLFWHLAVTIMELLYSVMAPYSSTYIGTPPSSALHVKWTAFVGAD